MRRLGAASIATATVASPGLRRSRSDLELAEWKDPLTEARTGQHNQIPRPWKVGDVKFEPKRGDVMIPPGAFKRGHDETEYSGSMELSRRLK